MVRRDETQNAQEVPEQIGLSQRSQSKEASNPFTQLPNGSLQRTVTDPVRYPAKG